MAASYSRPGCVVCGGLSEGLGCGTCARQVDGSVTASSKRRNVVRRAWDRIGGPPRDGSPKAATARCGNDHIWRTFSTPGRDDAVEDPRCPAPECGQHAVRIAFVKGTVNLDIPCLDACKNAKNDECECSCGGTNHGINLGQFRYVKRKSGADDRAAPRSLRGSLGEQCRTNANNAEHPRTKRKPRHGTVFGILARSATRTVPPTG